MNIYLESNFLDEFGVGDEYDGQRNSEAKGVDEDYVPGMCEYISMCEYYSDMCENKGSSIYYVITFGGLGRPLPPHVICNHLDIPPKITKKYG